MEQIDHSLRHHRVGIGQESIHFARRVEDHPPGQPLVAHPAHALEYVTEGPVPQVVQETRRQAYRLLDLFDGNGAA